METRIDEAGRVTIPPELRTQFGLKPGMKLRMEASEAGVILKPAGQSPAADAEVSSGELVWEDNILVYRSAGHSSVESINNLIRSLDEERDRAIWNPAG